MKKNNTKTKRRLERLRELYSASLEAYSERLELYEKNLSQYKGDDRIDGSKERAATVRNITYEIIESQISSDIPPPKVDSLSYSEKRERCAEAIERLLYSIRDTLPYEKLNDTDERYTYIYGASVWYAEWDNEEKFDGRHGGVRIYCLSPEDFIPQPNTADISDMEYCFLRFTTTKEELMRKFNLKREELDLCEVSFSSSSDIPDEDTLRMVIAFYKDDDGDVCRFIFSGEVALSDVPKYYKRKRWVCDECREERALCRCGGESFELIDEEYEELIYDIQLSSGDFIHAAKDGAIPQKIPYYTPKIFPIVIRKNIPLFNSPFGQSDCEYIRPEQQAINKIESRILQKLLRAGVTPIVPEDASITLNNSVFGQLIRIKPGESIAQYGKVDTTPDITQDIAEAERLYDHAKRILGISDALQGLDTHVAESGYSRQLKISQAAGRLESKRKMKHAAYAELDRLIFLEYLAFADEPRRLTYKDSFGRIHDAAFNKYDFLEYDAEEEKYLFDDSFLFSVDLNGGAEYQREALWERNLENLKSGTLGDSSSPVSLLRYWQLQERAHYPFARENVEYFKAMVEKEREVLYAEENQDEP